MIKPLDSQSSIASRSDRSVSRRGRSVLRRGRNDPSELELHREWHTAPQLRFYSKSSPFQVDFHFPSYLFIQHPVRLNVGTHSPTYLPCVHARIRPAGCEPVVSIWFRTSFASPDVTFVSFTISSIYFLLLVPGLESTHDFLRPYNRMAWHLNVMY